MTKKKYIVYIDSYRGMGVEPDPTYEFEARTIEEAKKEVEKYVNKTYGRLRPAKYSYYTEEEEEEMRLLDGEYLIGYDYGDDGWIQARIYPYRCCGWCGYAGVMTLGYNANNEPDDIRCTRCGRGIKI